MIRLYYSSVDDQEPRRHEFPTLSEAQAFAHRQIGRYPSLGAGYAISDDGIGKITTGTGCTLRELFPGAA